MNVNDISIPVNIQVLFFAKARELSGCQETGLRLPSHNILLKELLDKICSAYNLDIIKRSLILAVNERYCDDLEERLNLREGDEIAVIPPISGG